MPDRLNLNSATLPSKDNNKDIKNTWQISTTFIQNRQEIVAEMEDERISLTARDN
jgi:hypothetical protein